ncbi:universal stress protein [Pseudonocardia sp. CA-142604]|uniref:universal stress protein n=1 Tax=Pseudonocardia sp. CA-142604 TaxID=3240024 RepID=UPI003D9321A8
MAGVDGSAAGHAGLMLTAELADSLGARLVAVHAWADVVPGPHGGGRRLHEDAVILAEDGAHVLDSELDLVAATHPALPIDRVPAEDTALRALLHHAASARMLVVGHRGHHQIDAMTPGSRVSGSSNVLRVLLWWRSPNRSVVPVLRSGPLPRQRSNRCGVTNPRDVGRAAHGRIGSSAVRQIATFEKSAMIFMASFFWFVVGNLLSTR